MIRRSDVTVSDAQGTPEGGVYITVKDDTGALATLYNDAGTLMANPFQSTAGTGVFTYNIADGDAGTYTEEYRLTALGEPRTIQSIDLSLSSSAVRYAATRTGLAGMSTGLPAYLTESGRDGSFVWSSANLSTQVATDTTQGIYVPPTGGNGSTGAWVRRFAGAINVKWFGATGDGTTNDGAAVAAAIAFAKTIATNPTNSIYKASGVLFFPAGHYYLGTTTLDITHTLTLQGEGGIGFGSDGITIGGAATKLRWAANTTGLRFQDYQTSGASTIDGAPHFAGRWSQVRDMHLVGGMVVGTTAEGEYHGVHTKVGIFLERVQMENFQGDGLYSDCSVPYTNSNTGKALFCNFVGNRCGRYMAGTDSNAWMFVGCGYANNRRAGVYDVSLLGNTESGAFADGNGFRFHSSHPTSIVERSGNHYAVVLGQAVGASTNAPSGTTADNTWWYYLGAGGATANIPTWSNGISVRDGGQYVTNSLNASNVFMGCYSEAGTPPCQFTYPTMVLGGGQAAGVKGTGVYNYNYQGSFRTSGNAMTDGNMTVVGSLSAPILSADAAAFGQLNFRRGGVLDANLFNLAATLYCDVDTFNHRTAAGTQLAAIDANGLGLAAGKVLKVNGTQVVSARDTGWTADTGTAKKTANATYTVGSALTVGATYVQAEHTAIITRQALVEAALRDATQTIKAIKDALLAHGLTGA